MKVGLARALDEPEWNAARCEEGDLSRLLDHRIGQRLETRAARGDLWHLDRDPVQGPLLTRPIRIEEGDFSAPCVSSKECKAVRALDLVHAGDLRDHCRQSDTLVDPECHVVEGGRFHANDIPATAPAQPVLFRGA